MWKVKHKGFDKWMFLSPGAGTPGESQATPCPKLATTPSLDSSTLTSINKCTNTDIIEAEEESHNERGVDPLLSEKAEGDIKYDETTFLEGPERRLSHEESQKPDLSDWEWCRSKSERTPRQVQ